MPWQLLQYHGAFDKLWGSCTEEMRDSIRPRLAQLLLKGNMATFPITEPLGDGLFEVRARWKKVRIRLLYGYLPGRCVVFVWGGMKDQRKLPAATIAEARRLLEEAKASIEALHVVHFN
jgi:hypothetical protein